MLKINFSLEKLRNKPTLFRFDFLGLINSFYAKFQFGKLTKEELYFVRFAESLTAHNTQTYQQFLEDHLHIK